MLDSFVRVAAATPEIRVADPAYNAKQILALMARADSEEVQLLCLPELCLTGYTCGDLFHQSALLTETIKALELIRRESSRYSLTTALGMPVSIQGKLYNTAVILSGGKIVGIVPKTHLPGYSEFYEPRHFVPAPDHNTVISLLGEKIPFGSKLLFQCEESSDFFFAVEICEDLWAPCPPSISHAVHGANVILNLSASDETVGKAAYRRSLVSGQSARLICGYVYAGAGQGESTTDMVFAGHNLICENGSILAESPLFGEGWACSELDLCAMAYDRRRMNTFSPESEGYEIIPFSAKPRWLSLGRKIDPTPFVPSDPALRRQRCMDIMAIQAAGLAKRLSHTGGNGILGISGGLDSSLALLVACDALRLIGKDPSGLLAVTMPCFGTTSRTRENALRLCVAVGVPCREIDISRQTELHLRELGHDLNRHDVVYENAQARIRTLQLMNLANQSGGIVIGTGDLSELALGWATYNGDHMSMYAVNAGVPKTLVRHLIEYVADTCGDDALRAVLLDILDTPISPELLPPDGDSILQKTEELVGPYELSDFYLYHLVRWGRAPALIYRLACLAFQGRYTEKEILHWLKIFVRRFFAQQFKRSCIPDGPKIGSVTLSPRADWRMPSDAVCDAWLQSLEEIE